MKTSHTCLDTSSFDPEKFLQRGSGVGEKVLIIGESPAENGWRKSGKACYSPEGKLLPTGVRLNELLVPLGLSVETCGFTELAKCFVGKDRHHLDACAKNCWPIFEKQLTLVNPQLLILLGVKTLGIWNSLTGTEVVVGEISKVPIGGKNYYLLPIFHPSPINPFGRAKNEAIFNKNIPKIRSLIGN